jgi:hypothetical protein
VTVQPVVQGGVASQARPASPAANVSSNLEITHVVVDP